MTGENRIKGELQIHRLIIVVLIGVVIFLGFRLFHDTAQVPSHPLTPPSELPYYEKIMSILNPLEYSGIVDLMKPEVDMKLDFKARTWTLTNLHKFDAQGNIILDHDRYGLCGELAAYVYKKIVPFMKDHFEILFLEASESGFFLRPHSTHILLLLIDKITHEHYFIDPSFQRYGKEEDFSDYQFFGAVDPLTHLASLKTNVSFGVDLETPLLIRKNFLLCLGAESLEGKFDKDNFELTITANKRHDYSGREIFVLRRRNGKTETFSNEWLLHQLLTHEESQKIFGKMTGWFETASQGGS